MWPLSLAGFQVITYGRFWVITEDNLYCRNLIYPIFITIVMRNAMGTLVRAAAQRTRLDAADDHEKSSGFRFCDGGLSKVYGTTAGRTQFPV